MNIVSEKNFLLTTPIAERLYHEVAAKLPIVDFHNHLNVNELINDRQYNDIAELWLISDPYKHRAMRICGVDEHFITGDADNFKKFSMWCTIFPQLIGNPLYHWSQMELGKILGIEKTLCGENARYIWDAANEKLSGKAFSARGILDSFNVRYAALCCNMTDVITAFDGQKKLAPSLRGDEILPLELSFIQRLEKSSGIKVGCLSNLSTAFAARIDAFHRVGCRFSDHALDDGFKYREDDGRNDERLAKILGGERLSEEDECCLSSQVLRILGTEYAKHHWVMQLHCGARRHTSSRLRSVAGPAGGFAAIGKSSVEDITVLLNDLEKGGSLPSTIIFTLNPADNAALAILSGSFNESGIRGKVQQGTAWWWCDHLSGMCEVFESISSYSVLSTFLGMTTDSRSILSFVRHEYFRRTLCGWIGEKAEKGIFPNDFRELVPLCENICYKNAESILNIQKGTD